MKTRNTFVGVVLMGMRVVGIATMLGFESLASPIALPDWVKPIESALPKLSPVVISEVDDLCEIIDTADTNPLPHNEKKSQEARLRLVELREQASLAMIWQCFKESEQGYGLYLSSTLEVVQHDRELAGWLLPILRHRIQWLKTTINDSSHKNYSKGSRKLLILSQELTIIGNYLLSQGEYSDIENLNALAVQKSKLLGNDNDFLSDQERIKMLQNRINSIREAREFSERNTKPFWRKIADELIEEGVLTSDVLLGPKPGVNSIPPQPLGPRGPLPEPTPPPFVFVPQTWMVWPIWIFIVLVSVILLRWLFRKPKRN